MPQVAVATLTESRPLLLPSPVRETVAVDIQADEAVHAKQGVGSDAKADADPARSAHKRAVGVESLGLSSTLGADESESKIGFVTPARSRIEDPASTGPEATEAALEPSKEVGAPLSQAGTPMLERVKSASSEQQVRLAVPSSADRDLKGEEKRVSAGGGDVAGGCRVARAADASAISPPCEVLANSQMNSVTIPCWQVTPEIVNVRLTLNGKAKMVRHAATTRIADLLAQHQVHQVGALVAKDDKGFEMGGEVSLGQLVERPGDVLALHLEPDVW